MLLMLLKLEEEPYVWDVYSRADSPEEKIMVRPTWVRLFNIGCKFKGSNFRVE
jgi:hypothetical protein